MPSVWTLAEKQICKEKFMETGDSGAGNRGGPLEPGYLLYTTEYFKPTWSPMSRCLPFTFSPFPPSCSLPSSFSCAFRNTKGHLFLKSITFHDAGAVEMLSAVRWMYS